MVEASKKGGQAMTHPIYDIAVKKIDGTPTTLGEYEGKVLLIVNVASKCGLTPQYDQLESLYKTYKGRGLEVLGFPANEFGAQEPGTNSEIATFCRGTFGVDFPMFEKIVVKGEAIHPLYRQLTGAIAKGENKPGEDFDAKMATWGIKTGGTNEIRWNFEKFLVNRKGEVVARFMPGVEPTHEIVTKAIEGQL
jgi:glutathione peroxidase